MAEGLLCYTRPGDPTEQVDRTQGRPLSADDELRIVDDAGLLVPDGTEGELLVRVPYTINGYFRAESDNARSFDRPRRYARRCVIIPSSSARPEPAQALRSAR